MTKDAKIRGVELLACDAGWRNYHFVKITTDGGIVGWSEFDEGLRLAGASAPRSSASPRGVVGQNALAHERIYAELFFGRPARRPAAWSPRRSVRSKTRCSTPRQNCSGCQLTNCWAARSATASGSTGRTAATWRINHPGWYKPEITDLDGVKSIGREVREKKFTALKTNIFTYDEGRPRGWRPGFGSPFEPEINVDRKVLHDLRMHLEAIRDGRGP